MSPRSIPLLLWSCCSALAWAGLGAAASAKTTRLGSLAGGEFDWEGIKPSPDLVYHDCYDGYKCARLSVPLDWLNETDTRTAAIAMIKLPALVPDDDPAFSGPIFTNPGGPGGSGVNFIFRMGRHLRRTVDKPGRRHYEIISFDPRGVGLSTPAVDCFHHDILARDAMAIETRGNGPLSGDRTSLRYSLAMMDVLGQRCKMVDEQWGNVLAYVGTPSVARDMVEMVDKVDELRKREAATKEPKQSSHSNHRDEGAEQDPRQELRKRSALLEDEPRDVPRLQYIGFSYGTILGNYFAALFPGRIGRLLLDGVCNTDDYATGPVSVIQSNGLYTVSQAYQQIST